MAINTTTHTDIKKLVRRDVCELAPKMRLRVQAAESECSSKKVPVYIYECLRSNELAQIYYRLGSSRAPNGLRTWHFYGLAVDIVHPVEYWNAWPVWDSVEKRYIGGNEKWWKVVVEIFKRHGMDWGGDWAHFKDTPHFQWDRCKPSPSNLAVSLYKSGGVISVWKAVGAD